MWRVKICGNRTPEDVRLVVASGVDALGLIVGVRHTSEDAIPAAVARSLLALIPDGILSVMVTHLDRLEDVLALHAEVPTGAIQLHDDIAEGDIRSLRRLKPSVPLIKAVHVTGEGAIERASVLAGDVDALLLDSRTEDRIGGTGVIHDWTISAQVVQRVPRPVILAGGLTPDNVDQALDRVRPHGVDVNSGVDGADGAKDPEKVRLFVARARAKLAAIDAGRIWPLPPTRSPVAG
jgi:phosphoribosylanthranilate isomerase